MLSSQVKLNGGCNCNGASISFGDNCDIDASSFNITVTSPSGCEITLVPANTIITTGIQDMCFVPAGGTPISGGSGNYTYLWSNGAISEDLTNLSDGDTYTVEVTDIVSGCVYTSSATIVNDISTSALTVSTSATGDDCGSGNGTAVIDNVTGGSGTYSYEWSNGETTASISGLSAPPVTLYALAVPSPEPQLSPVEETLTSIAIGSLTVAFTTKRLN